MQPRPKSGKLDRVWQILIHTGNFRGVVFLLETFVSACKWSFECWVLLLCP